MCTFTYCSGMIAQTIAYPIKIANAAFPEQLRAYVCASSPSFRCRQQHGDVQRNSYLLSLGPKTYAHHGVNCALWGMLPGILRRCKPGCTCIIVVQGSCSGQAAANCSSRPCSAVVTFRTAGGPPPVPWPLRIRALRARGRPSCSPPWKEVQHARRYCLKHALHEGKWRNYAG
jgi:hypothetical protein